MKALSPGREARRRRILDAASHAFARKDYAEVSLGEIAARAGVARGTIYNYFGCKERLHREVLARRMGELARRLEESLRRDADPVRNLRRCIVHPFMFFVTYPNLLLLWRRQELRRIASGPGEGGDGRGGPGAGTGPERTLLNHLRGMTERLASLTRGVLCEGIRAGLFRSVDPEAASHLILGAVEGMAAALSGTPAESPRVARAREELHEFIAASLGAGRRMRQERAEGS